MAFVRCRRARTDRVPASLAVLGIHTKLNKPLPRTGARVARPRPVSANVGRQSARDVCRKRLPESRRSHVLSDEQSVTCTVGQAVVDWGGVAVEAFGGRGPSLTFGEKEDGMPYIRRCGFWHSVSLLLVLASAMAALAQGAKPAPDLKTIVGKWSGTGQSAAGNNPLEWTIKEDGTVDVIAGTPRGT